MVPHVLEQSGTECPIEINPPVNPGAIGSRPEILHLGPRVLFMSEDMTQEFHPGDNANDGNSVCVLKGTTGILLQVTQFGVYLSLEGESNGRMFESTLANGSRVPMVVRNFRVVMELSADRTGGIRCEFDIPRDGDFKS